MARSTHSTYTAADRYERRHAARGRRYRRHLQALAIRAEIAEV
jgi:hypothetical protein